MTRTKQTALIVLLAASVARPALAQAPSPLMLTLEDAWSRALAEAPRLAAARAQEVAAEAAVLSRTASGRPWLTATSSVLRTNHVEEFGVPQAGGGTRILFPDLPTNYRARAEMTVPLYTAGRVGALVESAQADRRAVDADRRTLTADLRLEVATAYWTLVTARERVTVLERAGERSEAALADVRARVDAGVLPPNELLSSQAQRARQNVQLIHARNDAALSEVRLARLVGVDLGQPIVTLTPVDQPTPGGAELATLPVATIIARAREVRAERQSLVERQSSLRAAATAARSASLPQIAMVAAFEPARPNPRFVPRVDTWNNSWDLGLNVTWSLWDGGRSKADRAGILARADAIGHHLEEFDAGVAVEVYERVLSLESSRAALSASGDAVTAASEARRVVGERFAVGVATSTEMLDADVVLLESELERTRLAAAVRLGEARLVRTAKGE